MGETRYLFLYPAAFILFVFVVVGWFGRGVWKHSITHPAPFLLERFRQESRRSIGWWFGKLLGVVPVLVASLGLVAAGFVLALPQEQEKTIKTESVRRVGIINLDVSSSTVPQFQNAVGPVIEWFIRGWLTRYPNDLLGIVAFADGATILGTPTGDANALIQNLRDAPLLTTNYNGGTNIERGLFASFIAATPQLTPLERDVFEGMLRRSPKDFAAIERTTPSNILAHCKGSGAFVITFTDGIISLQAEQGMASPLVLFELMGRCGIRPFYVTTIMPSSYEDNQKPIINLVKRYGGRDYNVEPFQFNNVRVQEAVQDIARLIPPAPVRREIRVQSRDIKEFFAVIAVSLFGLWVLYYLFWKVRRSIPFGG